MKRINFIVKKTGMGTICLPTCPNGNNFPNVGSCNCKGVNSINSEDNCPYTGGLNPNNSRQVICHYPNQKP